MLDTWWHLLILVEFAHKLFLIFEVLVVLPLLFDVQMLGLAAA
jgi:hypothetical protein